MKKTTIILFFLILFTVFSSFFLSNLVTANMDNPINLKTSVSENNNKRDTDPQIAPEKRAAVSSARTDTETKKNKIFYVSQSTDLIRADKIVRELVKDTEEPEVIDKDQFDKHKKRIFLSPNREFIAVTVENYYSHEPLLTYIADLEGNLLTPAKPGYFVSWNPKSSGVLLYLSIEETGKERQINYLDTQGNYYDFELPKGVTNAEISSKEDMVYTLTENNTDNSILYVRNNNGQDRLLLADNKNIFSWTRWSPDGEKIAFIKSDLALKNNELWIINSDGSNLKRVSNVNIAYPSVWSKKGDKLLFTNGENVWEHDVNGKSLISLTNFTDDLVRQPNYSEDEKTVVFSRETNEEKQIWSVDREGKIEQLTFSNTFKNYPLIY